MVLTDTMLLTEFVILIDILILDRCKRKCRAVVNYLYVNLILGNRDEIKSNISCNSLLFALSGCRTCDLYYVLV